MLRSGTRVLVSFLFVFSCPAVAALELELEECRISAGEAFPGIKARCGSFERPLNPDDPDSPTISLRVAVVPALNLQPHADPLVPLAGGPGQSAVQFYSGYAAAFERVRSNRDILLVDQRGTGESARMDCPIDDDLDEYEFDAELTIKYTQECLDALPYDPRYFTTSIAVQDLEAVRKALGYPTLNLYGASYGTRVAQHYARRYPDSTRTIILDGVVPPQLSLGPEIAIESQKAIDNIFARCTADPACNAAFPDVAASFVKLRNTLSKKAVNVSVAHPVTGRVESVKFGQAELAATVRLLAYSPRSIAMLPLLVSEASNSNYPPLVAQYQMTLMSLSETLAIGMHNTVLCTEDAPFFNPDAFDMAALEGSFMGTMQLRAIEAICSVWPAGPIDEDFKQPLSTAIPTLLLSGTADPSTPPHYADMAARNLKKAWLLNGEHQGHGQLAVGCMPRIVEQFIDAATFEISDAACLRASFVMPFFLDFSGPAP
ncbi:MAG: alpha/beta fold hydrolase [Gammaproteobacteria bacterium]|nr:MAG: alpha/beta fold hydrolase [Gammaproteobacteria bacterium]